MISRRTVLNGTALGSALAALTSHRRWQRRAVKRPRRETRIASTSPSTPARSPRPSTRCARRSDGRTASGRSNRSGTQIKTFLRQAGKYPDYIEVGTDVWHQVYDWHVRYQQPMTVARSRGGALHHSAVLDPGHHANGTGRQLHRTGVRQSLSAQMRIDVIDAQWHKGS